MPKVTMPDNLKNIKKEIVKEINPEKRVDIQLLKPGKYELTEEDTFKIEFSITKKDGRWVVLDGTVEKVPGVEEHCVEFKMWSFEEDVALRKMCTSYDPLKRLHFVDNDVLNRVKVQRLLKSWTFERDNPRLKILHVGGVLSDESYTAFSKLQPNIIRHILERMNNVLEFNG